MLYLGRNIGADVHWRKIRLEVGGVQVADILVTLKGVSRYGPSLERA